MRRKEKLIYRLAKMADLHGPSVVQQAAPYLFAACLLWWSLSVPEEFSSSGFALDNKERYLVLLLHVPSWAVLISFIMGLLGTIASNRNLKDLQEEVASLNKKINDSQVHHSQELTKNTSLLNRMRANLGVAEEHVQSLKGAFGEAQSKYAMGFLRSHCNSVQNFGARSRVSLYAHLDDQFVLTGRFTEHPEHIKPNRLRFPDNMGCIGKAWLEDGEFSISIPEDPNENLDHYLKTVSRECNLNASEARNIRMKSRFYYAKAITHDRIRIGVIVYESLDTDSLNEVTLRNLVLEHESFLRELIQQTSLINPFMMREVTQ